MKRSTVVLFAFIVSLPPFATSQTPYTWTQKVPGSGHGNSLCANPVNPDVVYGSPNTNVLWISRDRGNTWVQLGNTGTSGGIAAIAVNPLDTNQILVAQRGSPNRVMKTTNNGQTWTQTWAGGSFNSYGVPLEHKPYYPGLVYVMGSTRFYRSDDFGSTWTQVSTASFNAWCDAEISPLSPNVILLGTVGSGIWRSTDGGRTWSLVHANGGGEIPMLGWSPSHPNIVYGTRWGGLNGIVKSTDGGTTWVQVPQITGSMWSLAVSPRDPNYVVSCNYGTSMYITRNGGQSWTLTNTGLTGSGNGALVVDTFKVFALNAGIFKLNVPGNFSSRNVRMVLSVNVNHGLDYRNDYVLLSPQSVWVKGELPVLGGLQGNWTFADTVNGTLVRLYDDGTNGDVTPGDNIWTRSIIVPSGTNLGQFRYKYGAAYPGVDTVNDGVEYLNNESAATDFHLANFTDSDSVLVLSVDRWKTRGIVSAAGVTMSVDLRGGADFYSRIAVSTISRSVWLKGSLPVLGRMAGDWTFADTSAIMVRLYDDGTHGDGTAGDRIWTRAMTFPENTRAGSFNYRYSVVYPGVENNNGGVAYLNNESAPNQSHAAVLPESTATLSLSDQWTTRFGPVIQVTPSSFDLSVQQGDTATQTLVIANAAEFGSRALSYAIFATDPAFEQFLRFGSFAQTFVGASRDRGNIYSATRNASLTEIRAYLGIASATDLYFFVYEGDTRTGQYTRIFQTNGMSSGGTRWYSSGPIAVTVRAGMFYYIGASWMGSVTYGKAPDSTFTAPIEAGFGSLLTGQSFTVAGYPPASIINGSPFSNTYAPYYQTIGVNALPYITLSRDQGVIAPEASQDVVVNFDATNLEIGEYFPVFTIRSNDPLDSIHTVTGRIVVTPIVAVGGSTVPTEFALQQNYPNPFNPTTTIRYQLPVAGNVSIAVLNILGQKVTVLANALHQPGQYQSTWEGRNVHGQSVASGLYFYQLTVTDPTSGARVFQQRRKMLLLK